jgi:ABC-type multidrug transport system ATPase subunit
MFILLSPHPFCILDEPFSGLAPLQIQKLQELMKEMKAKKGILVTDHLHEQVRSIANDVYVLNHGKTYLVTDEEQLRHFGYLTPL